MSEKNASLEGQVALVTGGNTGIGAGICRALARAGADVVIHWFQDRPAAEELSAELSALGRRTALVSGDVSDEDQVIQLFDLARRELGRLDILVSNAGVEEHSPLAETGLSDWRKVMAVNLDGAFLCARQAVRCFLDQEEGSSAARGKIVFTSSVHEEIPWPGGAAYSASKGGLRMFMENIAQELAGKKIRVNAVGPGAIRTAINKDRWDDPEKSRQVLARIPYGRWGEPDDVGPAVAWLCSDAADYVTGHTLFVDGGMTLYPSFLEKR